MQASEKQRSNPRILLVPLDWGLGHATRCIPVIYEFLAQKAEVWLAGEGAQEALLKREFPQLTWLPLPGYRIRYGRSPAGLLKNIFLQLPRMYRAIRHEQQWLQQVVADHQFDAVISDNRFGLYHQHIPTVFLTHQLQIKSPFGKWGERALQKSNYSYINRFAQVWVPDHAGENNIAGELSHPGKMPAIPVKYIGFLSRLKKTGIAEKKKHLFISLSGPEPQRSLLENKIVREISHYNGTATIVRGLPGRNSIIPSTNDIHFYNHLDAAAYATEMESAEYVIGRSGYSTIMDLVTMKKKSILIPTPGQTEQEYLAKYLGHKRIACTLSQKEFTLDTALDRARTFSYDLPQDSAGSLKENVTALLQSL
jgi:hypothetical protein